MAPINGTQPPITVSIPNNTKPAKKKAVKSDDICDHPTLLTGIITAGENQGSLLFGRVPAHSPVYRSIDDVIDQYNDTSENTFTGTAREVAQNHSGTTLLDNLNYYIAPNASLLNLKMTQDICAENDKTE